MIDEGDCAIGNQIGTLASPDYADIATGCLANNVTVWLPKISAAPLPIQQRHEVVV